MQKILFNDKFGLTQAVLGGRKTMTRRIIPELVGKTDVRLSEFGSFGIDDSGNLYITELNSGIDIYPKYQIGEMVAVVQSYKDAGYHPSYIIDEFHPNIENEAGWSNKMFVKACLMPHQIHITNIGYERLQDISAEDCLREGIRKVSPLRSLICLNASTYQIDGPGCENTHYTSPRGAFAALIDKVSGKGTWVSNPWVWVYEFELVK